MIMKKYTLLGHVFELEENAHHFLARYIERIEQYSTHHSISVEIIDDIKYSIIEKLYAYATPITEKQVIEVANSLGEPEVMFDESDEQVSLDEQKKGNIFTREKPVIWWVCYWLAKSLNVPVKIMRIIFLILVALNGTGLILYVILALFVPFKDKKKTTWAVGNVLFEIVRIAFWLLILSVVVPLTFGSLAGTWMMFFTPVIENQSIAAWIPQYMYGVGVLVSMAFLLLAVGTVGALFKQRWLNKTLWLLAAIVIVVGGVVTAGTGYKIVMQAMANQTTVEQNMVFEGSSISGDRVTIDMTNITDYTDSWPYFGVWSADVRLIRTTWTNISVQVKTNLRGQSDAHIQDAIAKLQPLDITGSANSVVISRTGKLFTSQIPFAGVHKHIIIAVPSDKEVFINKDHRTNMYVQNDGLGRWYCAAKVYVYNPTLEEFTCKNSSWEVFYDIEDDFDDMIEKRIEQRVQERMSDSMEERNSRDGYDAIPPMYPQE